MITKQIIAFAAHELMTKKNLDKITVKDIVEECHITRQTFYYHFRDIPDLLEWGLKQETQQLMKLSREAGSIEEAVMVGLRISENDQYRQMLQKIVKSRYRDMVWQVMMPEFRRCFVEIFRQEKSLKELPTKETIFLLNFYSNAVAGLLIQSFLEKNDNAEEMAHLMIRAMRGEIHF